MGFPAFSMAALSDDCNFRGGPLFRGAVRRLRNRFQPMLESPSDHK